MPICVVEKDDHLLKTKIVLKLVDKFSDEQAEKVFLNTEIGSKEDINVIIDYLHEYRPKVFAKLNDIFAKKSYIQIL